MSRGEVGNKMAGTLDLLLLPCGREDGGGGRLFECKTCSRRFPTFQALGGHRTSHSRPRCNLQRQMLKLKPRLHACPVCGLAFPMGQALGGHMRRHKMAAATAADDHKDGGASASASGTSAAGKLQWLDLNLPPLENELQLRSVGSSSSSPSTSQELTNNFSACSSYSA